MVTYKDNENWGAEMTNRTIQQKMVKLKKARRRFPKRYSANYVSVGMPPNAAVMHEYRDRTRSLAFDDDYLRYLEAKTRFKGVTPGRVEARERAMKLQEVLPAPLFIVYLENVYQRVRIYFNSAKTVAIVEHVDKKKMVIRKSIQYDSIEYARTKWVQGKCCWVEEVPFSSTS